MKRGSKGPSTVSGTQFDSALNVEVRIRELAPDRAEKPDAARRAPSQPWFVHGLVLTAVLAIAGSYVGLHLNRGWIPVDEGTLAQSALRVTQGQLPHLDFTEIYTGGLSFIHGFAFRLFGVNLLSLRICVFLFFLAWLPAVYSIAVRFVSPVSAGAVTLLAVAWSYPNYPAAMPSWYNLFFATFGAAALLRYLDLRTRRWLFVAGVCGGISVLVKVIGAYYIAGALLFFAYLEQSDVMGRVKNEGPAVRCAENSWAYRWFNTSSLLLFLLTLLTVLRARLASAELYHFALPSAVLVALILFGEHGVRRSSGVRFSAMFRIVTPFVFGIITPIFFFLLPFVWSGALPKVLFGVTGSAVSRIASLALIPPQGIEKLLYVLPVVSVLAAAMYWDRFQGKAVGLLLGLCAVVLAVKAARSLELTYEIWCSVAMLTPIVVLSGAALAFARGNSARTILDRQQVFLLISVAGCCSLVQFPLAAAMYLTYTAPLTLLAAVAIVSTGKVQRGTYALPPVIGLYLVFGVFSLIPLSIFQLSGLGGPVRKMNSPRAGGLKIEQAELFDGLVPFLQDHSPNGLMYAGNDCPELYFLSGLKNILPDDAGAPPEAVLKALLSPDLKLVVINEAPYFPGAAMNPQVRAEVLRQFPNKRRMGIFQVFWRE